jgi:hypothetical protein
VDFIGSMLGYDDIWIDAKVRSYTGYDYTDIAIEEKSLDIRKKKSDMLLYITPNRDHIACYAIDLNIVRDHTSTIPVKGIRAGKK